MKPSPHERAKESSPRRKPGAADAIEIASPRQRAKEPNGLLLPSYFLCPHFRIAATADRCISPAIGYWLFFGIYIYRNHSERNYRQTSAKKFAPNAIDLHADSAYMRSFRRNSYVSSPSFREFSGLICGDFAHFSQKRPKSPHIPGDFLLHSSESTPTNCHRIRQT
jgi:hypothetical protein